MSHASMPIRSRRLAALAALALVGAAGLTNLPSALGASGVPSLTSSNTFLFAPPISITTSTHRKLALQISVLSTSYGSSFSSTNVMVGLNRKELESHDWNFNLSGTPFSASAKSGTGSLTTGTQLGEFGSLRLKVSSAGAAKTTRCGTVKTVRHPVSIKGVVDFKTHSPGGKSWGNVGTATKHFTFTHGELSTSDGGDDVTGVCASNACPDPGINYLGNNDTTPQAALFDGLTDGSTTLMTVSRSVTLSATASRQDSVFAHTTATPKHSSRGESLSLKPKTSTVTGSAVLRQAAKPTKTRCKKTTTADYPHAVLTSKKLDGHEQVFGPLKVASSSKGSDFSITTKRK
jgi:hypothetical protein